MLIFYIIAFFHLESHVEAWLCGSNARLLSFCYNPFNAFCRKCICDNGYSLIAGRCTNRDDPLYNIQKDLELDRFHKRIRLMRKDSNITITRIACPSNMVQVKHICPLSISWDLNCYRICKCKDGLRMRGGNCVDERKKYDRSQVITDSISKCGKENCRLGEVFLDFTCRRIGKKCGINMIFNLINGILKGKSCVIRCECEREFVGKSGQCVRSLIFTRKTTSEKTTTEFISSDLPKVGEKFYNSDCRQIPLACGKNMKLISIWKNSVDQQNRFACTQFCACKNEFVEMNGRCIKS
ncbi:unnamed protein product [Dracunculus medinensis]|uniref:EB domain-containing protein n=1 Tax=Dracunculus medinensis TaxID=318479 RepID=A0A0N4U390_DRAME|nr:unnamed protein product [Dracunculus medinensis]